jgi:hypothetical protein
LDHLENPEVCPSLLFYFFCPIPCLPKAGQHICFHLDSTCNCWTASPRLAAHLQLLRQLLQTTNHTAPSLYAAVHAWQHIHVTCTILQSSWQHLQRAETLMNSSMGCTCPPHQQHLLDSNIKTQGQQLLLISTPPGTKPAGQQHFHSNLQQVDSNITWDYACLLPFPNRRMRNKRGEKEKNVGRGVWNGAQPSRTKSLF